MSGSASVANEDRALGCENGTRAQSRTSLGSRKNITSGLQAAPIIALAPFPELNRASSQGGVPHADRSKAAMFLENLFNPNSAIQL